MAQGIDTEENGHSVKQSNTPYQLDLTQTAKACKVLQQHIASARKEREAKSEKQDLLSKDLGSDDGENGISALHDIPLWMVFTGKKHIADKTRLKPNTM